MFFSSQVSLLTNRDLSLPANNLKMIELSQTTTSRRNPPFTWFWDYVEVLRKGRRRTTQPPKKSSTRRRRSSLLSSNSTKWVFEWSQWFVGRKNVNILLLNFKYLTAQRNYIAVLINILLGLPEWCSLKIKKTV